MRFSMKLNFIFPSNKFHNNDDDEDAVVKDSGYQFSYHLSGMSALYVCYILRMYVYLCLISLSCVMTNFS